MTELSYQQRLAANAETSNRIFLSLPVIAIKVRDRHREQSREMVRHYKIEGHMGILVSGDPEKWANPKALREYLLSNPNRPHPARYQYVDVPGDE